MRIRTVDQLLEKIDEDRIWRIREIDALTKQCELRSNPNYVRIALRKALITMLYAHWEGFVKNSADNYLEFVAMQGLRMGSIKTSFLSIYYKNAFINAKNSKKNSSLIELCESLFNEQDKVIKIEHKNVINTNSNLNYDTLEEITKCIGLNIVNFDTKKKFIDMRLLGRRNSIAHGNHENINEDEVTELKDTVIELIDVFKTEIENAAVQKLYAKSN